MTEYLETSIDKFKFRVDTSCFYNSEGIWARVDRNRARLGLSDYLQQRSGDIAFVEVKSEGTLLTFGDEFSSIETIKVNIALSHPFPVRLSWLTPP